MLASPNWPQGMTSFSSMSWIVTLPSEYQADIQFVNVSQPECQEGHTGIMVKMLGYEEEILSVREDDQPVKTLSVPKSFYLNMSNCVPEGGSFGVLTKIVLKKTSSKQAVLKAFQAQKSKNDALNCGIFSFVLHRSLAHHPRDSRGFFAVADIAGCTMCDKVSKKQYKYFF